MTSELSLAAINAHWSGVLGREVACLPAGRAVVGAHSPALQELGGLYVWECGGACIVSAPQDLVMDIAGPVGGAAPESVIAGDSLRDALGDRLGRATGPAVIYYADGGDFVRQEELGARPLIPSDDDALRELSRDVGEEAWVNSNISFERVPIFGIYEQRRMVAAASYERWGERLLHVGVVTHPDYRGQGFGRGVAAATTAHALEAGGIAQWQTLASNAPSARIADALGFRPYCRTLFLQLK